jgi:hypothetical protein
MLYFERRLTEVISGMQPKVRKWKGLIINIHEYSKPQLFSTLNDILAFNCLYCLLLDFGSFIKNSKEFKISSLNKNQFCRLHFGSL